jgi:DNA-binding MarR family transcriptional regulator/N-acetylglutamate synthase-like GNAT family acetyltransferase
MSVTEIAKELEITHSAVSQLVNILEKRKLIKFIDDANDRRRRFVSFTPKGARLIPILEPIWTSMTKAMQTLMTEGDKSAHLLDALSQLEKAMERESVYQRIINEIKKTQLGDIDIVPFQPEDEDRFKNLILSWLIHNDNSKVTDTDIINRPENQANRNNALILMAKAQEESVGTIVAQIRSTKAEILFLVVDETWQRRHIGKKLLLESVRHLRKRRVNQIYTIIDRRISHAIRMFKDVGFILHSVSSEQNTDEVEGTTLRMELIIEE